KIATNKTKACAHTQSHTQPRQVCEVGLVNWWGLEHLDPVITVVCVCVCVCGQPASTKACRRDIPQERVIWDVCVCVCVCTLVCVCRSSVVCTKSLWDNEKRQVCCDVQCMVCNCAVL